MVQNPDCPFCGSSHTFDSMISKGLLPKVFVFIFPLTIILGNLYLFGTTKNKIETFTIQPPFLAFDFTNSYLSNRSSRIRNLLDQDSSTTWFKLRNSIQKEDFLVELRQTHHLKNQKPEISNWKNLHVVSCHETVKTLKLSIILRESIDMDTELRLPKDRVIGEKFLDFSKSKHFKIPLDLYYKPETSEEFPQNMFIWTVKGTWVTKDSDFLKELCLTDVWLSED